MIFYNEFESIDSSGDNMIQEEEFFTLVYHMLDQFDVVEDMKV